MTDSIKKTLAKLSAGKLFFGYTPSTQKDEGLTQELILSNSLEGVKFNAICGSFSKYSHSINGTIIYGSILETGLKSLLDTRLDIFSFGHISYPDNIDNNVFGVVAIYKPFFTLSTKIDDPSTILFLKWFNYQIGYKIF